MGVRVGVFVEVKVGVVQDWETVTLSKVAEDKRAPALPLTTNPAWLLLSLVKVRVTVFPKAVQVEPSVEVKAE